MCVCCVCMWVCLCSSHRFVVSSLSVCGTYLAKLLKAALCGLMHSGTRPVCSCSAINLCISSARVGVVDDDRSCIKFQSCRIIGNITRTFDLVHRCELALPQIVERLAGGRLKLAGVLAHASRRCKAALAHARMVPQATLVQVRMRQSIDHRNSLVLYCAVGQVRCSSLAVHGKCVRVRVCYIPGWTWASGTADAPHRESRASWACTGRTATASSVCGAACGSGHLRTRAACPLAAECPAVRWWAPAAGRGSAPGTGCDGRVARRKCSPPTRRRLRPNNDALPSVSRAPCSTVWPPLGSCVSSGRAPRRGPAQSRRSTTRIRCLYIAILNARSNSHIQIFNIPWARNYCSPEDCPVWCPDAVSGPSADTWDRAVSGTGTLWCGRRTSAVAIRWFCAGQIAAVPLSHICWAQSKWQELAYVRFEAINVLTFLGKNPNEVVAECPTQIEPVILYQKHY